MTSTNGITSICHDIEPTSTVRPQHQSTLAIHGDDHLNRSTDVSPALHVSTTFRYASNPSELVPAKDLEVWRHSLICLGISEFLTLFSHLHICKHPINNYPRGLSLLTPTYTPAIQPQTPRDSRPSCPNF